MANGQRIYEHLSRSSRAFFPRVVEHRDKISSDCADTTIRRIVWPSINYEQHATEIWFEAFESGRWFPDHVTKWSPFSIFVFACVKRLISIKCAQIGSSNVIISKSTFNLYIGISISSILIKLWGLVTSLFMMKYMVTYMGVIGWIDDVLFFFFKSEN